MSDTQTQADNTVVWPDLSRYGVTLGIVDMDGSKSLVLSDEQGKHAVLARSMGFARTRWPGLWVRRDLQVEPSAFSHRFPQVPTQRRTLDEIRVATMLAIQARVAESQQADLFGYDGPSAAGAIDLTPAPGETSVCGWNYLGEEVFQAPDGRRFTRIDSPEGTKMRKEPAGDQSDAEIAALFLRAPTPAALDRCADGLVHAMAHGRTVRVEDFEAFFLAVAGRPISPNLADDETFESVANAVDRARVRRLAAIAGNPDADAYAAALRLHDAAQYYTLVSHRKMTPLPIGVLLQHIASAMPAGSRVRIGSESRGEFSIFDASGFVEADSEAQDILLGAWPGRALDGTTEAFGTIVSREDHAAMLTLLPKMNTQGLGIFVIEGDAVPGRIGPSSRRFLDALANRFQIEGMVDVDGNLTGTPGSAPQRIIVVGHAHAKPGHGGLPGSIPFVTDYDELWEWGDRIFQALRQPGSVPYSERGAISNVAVIEAGNGFQAPYVPTSTLSEPRFMCPRNLAGPMRRAMINLQRQIPHVDDWLAKQLQTDVASLADMVGAEQVDGVVMGLHRFDQGLGFLISDVTGLGKGRQCALIARAQRIKGEPVVFLTQNQTLFQDFWRDVEHTGSAEYFKKILILNDGIELVSPTTGQVLARTPGRDEMADILRSGKIPAGVDLVLGTYSQFNREPAAEIRKVLSQKFGAKAGQEAASAAARARAEEIQLARRTSRAKKPTKNIYLDRVGVAEDDPAILRELPLSALKPLWLSKAVENATLIADECHNAAGEISQTGTNLTHAVLKASNVLYSSATWGRNAKTLRFFRRLFPNSVDVEELHNTLSKGGEPLQEALSSMLAEDGALIRREHDLSMLTFEPRVDTANKDRNERLSDQLAEILAAMTHLTSEAKGYSDAMSDQLRNALMARDKLERSDPRVQAIGVVKTSPIGNAIHMAMQSFITLLKAEFAADRAIARLHEGRKPLLFLEHTYETELARTLDKAREDGTLTETPDGALMPIPGYRQMLRRMLANMCQVSLDDNDLELKKQPMFASIVRMIEDLIEKFPDLPASPIDVIRLRIREAGFECGEISGRTRRIDKLVDGGWCMVTNRSKAELKKADKDGFNDGRLDALIITKAGAAGLSMHASPQFRNTSQRVFIEVETSHDVVTRTQAIGRVNRNDQLSHPIVETISTGLPAENRALAMANNQMRKMSANVTANRDNAELTKDVADIINLVGNEVTFRWLERNPELAMRVHIDMPSQAEMEADSFTLSGEKYVSSLLQRINLLKVAEQRKVIEELTQSFAAHVEDLDARGNNPLKPVFLDLHAKAVATEVLDMSGGASAEAISTFDRPVTVTTLEYKHVFQAVSSAAVRNRIADGKAELQQFMAQELGTGLNEPQETVFGHYAKLVVARRDKMMQTLLGSRWESVAAALASTENNIVKVTKTKTDQILDLLETLRIGGVLHYSTLLSERNMGVVTDVRFPPPEEVCTPSAWRVTLCTPGKVTPESKTFSTLFGDKAFSVTHSMTPPAVFATFDNTATGSLDESRQVLSGNVFRAAELAFQAGIGTQAHYSDENGVAHRAVVLPPRADLKHFSALPLRIRDFDLVKEFVAANHSGAITTSAKRDKTTVTGLSIEFDRGTQEATVTIPGSAASQAWMRNQAGIHNVCGAFGGDRHRLIAKIPVSDVPVLLDALKAAGQTLYAHAADQVMTKPLPPHLAGTRFRRAPSAETKEYYTNSRAWFMERLGLAEDPNLSDTAQLKSASTRPESLRRLAA